VEEANSTTYREETVRKIERGDSERREQGTRGEDRIGEERR
jgi:hypothetical protein